MNSLKYKAFFISLLFLVACDLKTGPGGDAANLAPERASPQEKDKSKSGEKSPDGKAPAKPGDPKPPSPKRPRTCPEVLDKFEEPGKYTLSSADLRNRFSLVRDLRSASKSGAFPSLVLSKQDNKVKFLKVFPKIPRGMSQAKILQDQSFLEIFQTCRLSKLYSHENLPAAIKASKFFVDVYEIGFLNALDPFVEEGQDPKYLYPYMLSEAVDNLTLTELATEPTEALKKLGFDLKSAPKMVLESILLQIIVALKNPHTIWGLEHNDIHPGNILLSKNEKADFIIDYSGKKMKLQGPLVKIIDFGLGESKMFKQKGLSFDLWIKRRPFIQELDKFINAARGAAGDISRTSKARMYAASQNQDILMFNLILRALKPILNSRGSTLGEGRYCRDYNDCIELVSQWWK